MMPLGHQDQVSAVESALEALPISVADGFVTDATVKLVAATTGLKIRQTKNVLANDFDLIIVRSPKRRARKKKAGSDKVQRSLTNKFGPMAAKRVLKLLDRLRSARA